MRTQPVEFLEFVQIDLSQAHSSYDAWQTDGARKFHDKFRETIAWIEWNPELFPKKHKSFRRAIIRRTFFGIYYVIEPKVTVVVSLMDLRRDPKTIRQVLNVRVEDV